MHLFRKPGAWFDTNVPAKPNSREFTSAECIISPKPFLKRSKKKALPFYKSWSILSTEPPLTLRCIILVILIIHPKSERSSSIPPNTNCWVSALPAMSQVTRNSNVSSWRTRVDSKRFSDRGSLRGPPRKNRRESQRFGTAMLYSNPKPHRRNLGARTSTTIFTSEHVGARGDGGEYWFWPWQWRQKQRRGETEEWNAILVFTCTKQIVVNSRFSLFLFCFQDI